jgi:hypothetical protein
MLMAAYWMTESPAKLALTLGLRAAATMAALRMKSLTVSFARPAFSASANAHELAGVDLDIEVKMWDLGFAREETLCDGAAHAGEGDALVAFARWGGRDSRRS